MPQNLSIDNFQKTYETNILPIDITPLLTPFDAYLEDLELNYTPSSQRINRGLLTATLDLLAEDLRESESLGIAETAEFQEQNRIVLSERPSAYGTKAFFKLAALRTNSQTTLTSTSTGQLGVFWPRSATYGSPPSFSNLSSLGPGPWGEEEPGRQLHWGGPATVQDRPGQPPVLGNPKGRPKTVRRRPGDQRKRIQLQQRTGQLPEAPDSAVQHCSTCRQPGHNSRSCRRPPQF